MLKLHIEQLCYPQIEVLSMDILYVRLIYTCKVPHDKEVLSAGVVFSKGKN